MREFSLGTQIDLALTLDASLETKLIAAGAPMRLARGDHLYRQEDEADAVFLLRDGQVQSSVVTSDGARTILRIHLPSSILGLTALSQRRVRDADAIAVCDALLIRVDRRSLLHELETTPALATALIGLLVDRMTDFHFRVAQLHTRPLASRLAGALLSLSRTISDAGETAHTTPITLTQTAIAELLGGRRQSINALLADFTAAGEIAREGSAIIVRDAAALGRRRDGLE